MDPTSDEPLFRQLHREFAQSIRSGRLKAGTKLPSSRVLAAELGVSRMTVLSALDLLRSAGLIEPQRGSGTYVAGGVRQVGGAHAPRHGGARNPQTDASAPFSLGGVHPRDFPFKAWATAESQAMRGTTSSRVTADGGLAEVLADYLSVNRGLVCVPGEVVITTGISASIELAIDWLTEPGETVWIEEPAPRATRAAAASTGARLLPVPSNGEGFDAAKVGRESETAKAAVIASRGAFPIHQRWPQERLNRLSAWAAARSAWIVDDDFDWEFDDAAGFHPPYGASADSRVFTAGGFGRLLAPVARVGYLVLPTSALDAMGSWMEDESRLPLDRRPAPYTCGALGAFLRGGHLSRYVRTLRSRYDERREALVSALRSELDGCVKLDAPVGAAHVVVHLPRDVDDVTVTEGLREQGFGIEPMSRCWTASPAGGLILGYTGMEPPQIARETKRLARHLTDLIETTRD